ncbi:unnamed protein product [Rotaria sp. Silwood1]|nr:unnamed protein product [Rotaria sp. Silwood1]
MFIRLLITSIFIIIIIQSTLTNNIKDKTSSTFTFPKQYSFDDDIDYINDKKIHNEGNDNNSNLDEYADEDDDDDDDNDDNPLSKMPTTTTIRTISTTTTTMKHIMTKIFEQKKKNETNTKKNSLDTNEFYDDYKEDLDDDDIFYNEPTIKMTTISLLSSTRLSTIHPTSIRGIFNFLTRPPIAAGILGGLAIGILTSVILLICIVQNFNKRDRPHSSITTGLLYPNQYGYSKSPQEFYA